jgi:hypothetical protein
VVPVLQLTDDDVRAWRELAEGAVEPNPLFEADCVIPAARHLPNGADVSLVIAEEEGRFFGCFPVMRVPGNVRPSTTWRGVRRPAFTTQVRRATYDGTPLVSGERGVEAATVLLSALIDRSRAEDAGILVLESLDDDGPVSTSVTSAAKKLKLPTYTYSWPRPVVRRRDGLTYRSIHSDDTLEKLARKRRRLGERLGGEVQLIDRSADPSAVDTLIAMEAAGWKAKDGGALLSHPGEPKWFREMCDRFRSAGRLLLYTLQVGETIVAMQLMLRAGEGLFDLIMTYDEDYSRHSPGIQLILDFIDHFHDETDALWLDTCTYEDNETWLRMCPDRRTVSTVVLAVGGRVDRLRLRLYAQVQNLFGARLFAALQRLFGARAPFRSRHPRLCRALDWAVSKWKRSPWA